jgi:Prion-inhibition and propagation
MTHAFDIAGLSSNLALPGQLFSTGVVAYAAISDIRNMGSSFGRQYWLFKVQESRYLFWGICHKACNPEGLNLDQMPQFLREGVVNALVQINSLLEDRDMFTTKYGLERVGNITPTDTSLIRRETQRQQNMVSRLHRGSSLLRKMQWVVRDQGKFVELTQQLASLIDSLHEFLPVPVGPWVDDAINAQTLADTLINAGKSKPAGALLGLPTPQPGNLNALQQAITAISTASDREQVENSTYSLRPMVSDFSIDMRNLEIQGQNIFNNTTPGLRAWARPKNVDNLSRRDFFLIEWREYDPRRGQDSREDLKTRIEALVKMLREKPRSDSFRVFDCLGYFMDNESPRFGLTFRFPSDYISDRDPAPMSLFELLRDYPSDIPYLGDRFRLAYLLAESIHGLHSVCWLHKSICSRNILFFRHNPHGAVPGIRRRPVSLESPHFTGFALSRPDGPAIDSSLTAPLGEVAIYRHKDVQGSGGRAISKYRAIYDIYSMGIVLLEIGTWKPVQSFHPKGAASNFDFSALLLRNVVPTLGVAMGENYMNVVRKCLEGSFGRLAGFDQSEYESVVYMDNVRQGLLWEVVRVLQDCRV